MSGKFLRVSQELLIPIHGITEIHTSEVEDLILRVRVGSDGWYVLKGNAAIEALMLLKPSALEGRRLRWVRNAWVLHNLVGHPLMQILCWLGLYQWGIAVHERTIPSPTGEKHVK